MLGRERGGDPARHEIAVSAPDRPALLVEWLSELVFLVETEGFVPERVVEFELADSALRASVEGYRGTPPHLVKAVTYHRLEFAEKDGRWQGRVVLDV